MNIQLMTDGGADLPKDLLDRYNVHFIPLNIHFGDEQFLGGVDIDSPTFYDKMRQAEELPRTSAPSPYAFYEAYKTVDPEKPILMIALSKELSTTYENALLAKEMLLEEEPERKIEVINSRSATSGMTLLVDEAGKRIEEGYTIEELTDHMNERVSKLATLILLRTVENLMKSGRLSRFKGAIAKTLNIKILMHGSPEGTIEVTEKVRGNKKAVRRFVEQIGEYSKDFENKVIAMSYSTAEDKAKNLLQEMMDRYPFKESVLVEMGPLIATHAGEGGFVISFFKD
ncbi:DegV family protein [Pontibacillus sp. ALD_SL1]|uniref:DegV family protein n=1 Tax=Pontibacillus sp. ALD_SL1 TaxID=2777185 RepID=UPI001A9652EC|nr:DegV family protein [Pontibacillus sp. ALD_SL1]QST00292.1 DegV family protein [Pontibacillus sp. ALD_SL1]